MSFLRYQGEEPELTDPPPRVYALVDRTVTLARNTKSPFAGDEVVLLDSVDADWFDETRREREGQLADARTVDDADRNVSILELRRRDLEDALGGELSKPAWIELELQSGYGYTAGWPVLHYLNLFAAPVERELTHASWAEPPLDRELADKTSMDDVPDANRDELEAILAGIEAPRAVAVYDVGHGNCDAALNEHAPVIYFDFGGGVLANRRTFPAGLTTFCFSYEPPIVLSHWDWDHWSTANRDTQAYAQKWILPRQGSKGLGAVHRTFLARLLQQGTVLVWPAGLPSLQVGAYEVLQCLGPPSSRNDSGLALVVSRSSGGGSQRMLLPGDCSYDHIPNAYSGAFTSLVASHHGGRTGTGSFPQFDGSPSGRLVYSYGRDNSYGHPFVDVRNDYTNADWYPALETPSRGPERGAAPAVTFGHVHLYWDPADADANPGCGGSSCQLTCHQR